MLTRPLGGRGGIGALPPCPAHDDPRLGLLACGERAANTAAHSINIGTRLPITAADRPRRSAREIACLSLLVPCYDRERWSPAFRRQILTSRSRLKPVLQPMRPQLRLRTLFVLVGLCALAAMGWRHYTRVYQPLLAHRAQL